jgi:hypothetical protein
MSVSGSQAQLLEALKQLQIRWGRIRERWDDPASRQIQKECVDPLEPMIRAAVRSLDQVSELMSSARRDCGDDA